MNVKFWDRKPVERKPKKKKGFIREWGDAILFAVIAASLIRWATFEAYTIPTPSMEKSLLVGDFLFVSKLHYGARTPMTPLQVPLTHQTIWGTNIKSYSDAIQLDSYRLPGFSEVKSGDVVVFNFPPEDQHPADLRTNYIKRCIGVGGDSVEIRNSQVFINGKAMEAPAEMQFKYFVETNTQLNEKFFLDRKVRLDEIAVVPEGYPLSATQRGPGYVFNASPALAKELASLDFVKNVSMLIKEAGEASPEVFPHKPSVFEWNEDNYGPVYVPKEGATVAITPETLPLYEKVILGYERNENAEIRDEKLYIDGKEVTQYTFKQNYYFMMGDNRHNSLDSRFWGFVPADHIVGKAVMIWMSSDPYGSGLNNIRWNRIFNFIE